jgi:hypothetical protein
VRQITQGFEAASCAIQPTRNACASGARIPTKLIDDYIAAINDAVRNRPAGMTICVHLCRAIRVMGKSAAVPGDHRLAPSANGERPLRGRSRREDRRRYFANCQTPRFPGKLGRRGRRVSAGRAGQHRDGIYPRILPGGYTLMSGAPLMSNPHFFKNAIKPSAVEPIVMLVTAISGELPCFLT